MRRYRVLVFGQSAETATDWLAGWDADAVDVLALDRHSPVGGRPDALGLWTDEENRAIEAAAHFGPIALLTEPVAVVPAPENPWNGAER